MDDQDDAGLVARCLRGEADAFEPLVARYQRVLFNVALRMVDDYEDARDVTQSAFVKAYEKLDSYDPRYRFFSWIYRIMLNESLNLMRARRPRAPLDRVPASSADPQRDQEAREVGERVRSALQELTREQREVIVLRHFGELTYEEMAVALALPEKTVKSRLFTARRRLADVLLERRFSR